MTHHIVIGAGLTGAAAAYSLTARGEDVTVLERHTPANDRGSSHGSARIFRYAYPDRLYTELVVRARELWDELESKSGVELITRTGRSTSATLGILICSPRSSMRSALSTRSSIPHAPQNGGRSSPSIPKFCGTPTPASSMPRPR